MTARTPFEIRDADLARRLDKLAFPRSARYDPGWVLANRMGPNALWLTEGLLEKTPLRSGDRVLDLGCGKALSSIFLAHEAGVEVWAGDLWIQPTENLRRIEAAGLERVVYPLRVEAHDLPFAHGYFDAVLSVDAYHYFGTDDTYLGYLSTFVKPGGLLAIVVPAVVDEFETVPHHLASWWTSEMWTFHSPEWWRRHLSQGGAAEVATAELIPDGWRYWAEWDRLCLSLGLSPIFPGADELTEAEAVALESDAGRHVGLARVVAKLNAR